MMAYKTLPIFPLLLTVLLLLSGCTSDKFDYRNRYTGTFKVAGTWESSTLPFDVDHVDVTAKATVDFAEEEQLLIEVEDLMIRLQPTVDRDGNLTLGSVRLGKFTDKNHFDISRRGWTVVGDYFAYDLHGSRK